MEYTRYFKASFEADSNKKTVKRKFDLEHYKSTTEMLDAIKIFFDSLEDGIMKGEWSEYDF